MKLADMSPGDVGECFVLLAGKERRTTRDGKPFYRLTFRDGGRSVAVMVWNDSAFFEDCDSSWKKGEFFRVYGRYCDTKYGPQFELDQVRRVVEEDAADGFDANDFYLATSFDPEAMFRALVGIAEEHIGDRPLRRLVVELLNENVEELLRLPAASRNHHAFSGGFLEHVLSVTRTAVFLADKYDEYYPRLKLSKDLVVAGAILHDIGKLEELQAAPEGATYTPSGRLIGHILLGRDLVRDKAATIEGFDREILLRLEHVIVAHQSLPEWGSPIPPSTPEALLVHYADDIDAKFHIMAAALQGPTNDDDPFTGRDNALRRHLFRGLLSD
ncbi:MAG: HD domain-containing protein [Planctomycetaceae bacterium]|nr:HD domain-containing protein [Planctomycetaceae bacterium]